MSLAKYIGVMSKPENERGEKISMTVRFFLNSMIVF